MSDASITWRVVRDNSVEWSNRLRARIAIETLTYANNVLAEAKANVRVRTGATRDSGHVTMIDELHYTVAFGGAGQFLEYGTSHMPAFPFLSPAAQNNLEAYLNRLAITTQGRIGGVGMIAGVA